MTILRPEFRELLSLISKKLFEVRPPLDNRQLDRCLMALREIQRSVLTALTTFSYLTLSAAGVTPSRHRCIRISSRSSRSRLTLTTLRR
jgi:hypothetical protein